ADRARAQYSTALTVAQQLTAKDPGKLEWQSELAAAHEGLGNVAINQGDTEKALQEHQAALTIRAALVTHEPSSRKGQRNLAISHDQVGDLERLRGDAASALAEFRKALALYVAVTANDPANPDQLFVANEHAKVGQVLLHQGQFDQAVAELKMSLALN